MFSKKDEKVNRSFQLYRDFFKHFFDIIFSAIAIILFFIPMIIIAIVIKIQSPHEPVLFRQTRVGKNDEQFTILKFRTMSADAPHQMATENFENPEKFITPIGRILRKTSLDELPQLFNVIKGEMSMIGPRPLIPDESEVLQWRDEFNVQRVLPGITGLAQVRGRDEVTGKRKAMYDGEYADNVSMMLDLRIFFKTLLNVAVSRGVHEGKKR